YANAAGRLSGSQKPTSSFSLNSANSNPSGLVTDGTTLWVTDDFDHKNNVFVYNREGTKVGAWILDLANDAPSGITLNPAGGSDLWVVDRHDAVVYHYAGATTRRSGTQKATDSFALAATDHHPEGIADPQPSATAKPGPIDFPTLSDVSASFQADYGRTSFNDASTVLYTDLSVQNSGRYFVNAPLIVAITHVSDPTVRVRGADGVTPDGLPFYDLSKLVSGTTLAPGD